MFNLDSSVIESATDLKLEAKEGVQLSGIAERLRIVIVCCVFGTENVNVFDIGNIDLAPYLFTDFYGSQGGRCVGNPAREAFEAFFHEVRSSPDL